MRRHKKDMDDRPAFNQIKPSTNVLINILFLVLALTCIFPLLFVFSISITSEEALRTVGYQIIPSEFSAAAYRFLWNERGMLSSYVVINNILGLRNTIWALILPLACSSFSVTICRTFFRTTVPDSIVESAKIDGAGQFRIWAQIVLPISKPVMATIGMFAAFGYWNDWFQASLYIDQTNLQTLQSMLNNIRENIEYLANNPYGGLSMQQYKMGMPTESVRMAIAIIIIVPIACTYPFFQKYFISGLTVGSVKE